MAFQILVNIVVSFMWMFLTESYTFVTFFLGYIIGAILLLFLDRFIPGTFYMRKVYRIIVLLFIFIRELILSNISIVKMVYSRKLNFEPGIFSYPTELKKDWQITLLANLITLTPGTLSIAISEDQSHIFIHAMHIDTIEDSINDIKNTFEKAIMEATK